MTMLMMMVALCAPVKCNGIAVYVNVALKHDCNCTGTPPFHYIDSCKTVAGRDLKGKHVATLKSGSNTKTEIQTRQSQVTQSKVH